MLHRGRVAPCVRRRADRHDEVVLVADASFVLLAEFILTVVAFVTFTELSPRREKGDLVPWVRSSWRCGVCLLFLQFADFCVEVGVSFHYFSA